MLVESSRGLSRLAPDMRGNGDHILLDSQEPTTGPLQEQATPKEVGQSPVVCSNAICEHVNRYDPRTVFPRTMFFPLLALLPVRWRLVQPFDLCCRRRCILRQVHPDFVQNSLVPRELFKANLIYNGWIG